MNILQLSVIIMIIYYVYFDQAISNIPGLTILLSIVMIACLLFYNFKQRLQGGLIKELSYEGKAYIIFFVLIFIPGLITSPYISSYLHSYLKGIQFAILFVSVFFLVKNNKNMDLIFKILGFSILAYALTAYFHGAIEPGTGRLIVSERGEPNGLALMMFLGIVIATYLWNKGLIYKVLIIGYIPIALSNVALSGSRKGFIGMAVFLFIFFICAVLPSINKKNIVVFLVSFTVLIALAVILYDWYLPIFSNSILFERFGWNLGDESVTLRVEMYRVALDLFKQYPFFGVGYDNFQYHSGIGKYSHSTYAEVLSCTGIIGAVTYFSIYISLTFKLIKLYIAKFKQKLPIYTEGIFLSYMLVDIIFCTVRIDLYDPIIFVLFGCMASYCKINEINDLGKDKHFLHT
ncbi:O-antigen ligase family protein [Dehalobacter sp. TeCB1]|uniref:O-antigen ligase family protein n=1 Tax=Dehalobacter sp. TeCB1 TaxID=1843715 RepID=UPI000839F579|nr:O-antigen ligase family protein [Dehalobacter sp. TeCB1]OCZ49436.1 hypothetical protein A7D23_02990 [Dehalobacter sp. TeCB1]